MEDMLRLFLDSRRSANTRRSYAKALGQFTTHSDKELYEVSAADVVAWITKMSNDGLAPSTINQRLAALRSFYRFCNDMDNPMINPVRSSMRRPVTPYGRAGYLRPEQARALLAVIDRSTLQGKRDYALFLTFIATGRRSAEIRNLRFRDLERSGGNWILHWRGKGDKLGKAELPGQVRKAMEEYFSGMWVDREPESGDFIFVRIDPTLQAGQRGISATTVSRLLRKYARKVGISGRTSIHMLRHTAAMLRKAAGLDVQEIRDFLGHSSIQVTEIYLRHLETKPDRSWITVAGLLGLEG